MQLEIISWALSCRGAYLVQARANISRTAAPCVKQHHPADSYILHWVDVTSLFPLPDIVLDLGPGT